MQDFAEMLEMLAEMSDMNALLSLDDDGGQLLESINEKKTTLEKLRENRQGLVNARYVEGVLEEKEFREALAVLTKRVDALENELTVLENDRAQMEDVDAKRERLEEAKRLGADWVRGDDVVGCNLFLQTLVRATVVEGRVDEFKWV